MTPGPPDPEPQSRPRLPGWVAAVPGLLIAIFFGVRTMVMTGAASRAISGPVSKTKTLDCVEVYSVTLMNSEYYVPEGQQFAPRKTPEISTVVSGMVRNNCAEPLKSVTIPVTVRDDNGKRGAGSVTVAELSAGEAKPFSKAWMGRVTSYEIGNIH